MSITPARPHFEVFSMGNYEATLQYFGTGVERANISFLHVSEYLHHPEHASTKISPDRNLFCTLLSNPLL